MFPLKSLTRQKEHRLLFRQAFGCIFTEKQKRGGGGQARPRSPTPVQLPDQATPCVPPHLSHNTVEAVGHGGRSPAPQHTEGQGTGCHSPVLHLQLKQMLKGIAQYCDMLRSKGFCH